MSAMLKVAILCLVLVGSIRCAEIPVDKCKLDDIACMGPAFQAVLPMFVEGVSDWGVEVMDPLQLDDIAFDLSGLQFTFKEGRMKGLKGAIINKVKWDAKKQKIAIDFNVNATVKGHYTAAGRLLILPISGDGLMKLRLRNMLVTLFLDFTTVTGEDGKKHVKITKHDFTFDVIDNAHFNLTGLFNGNKELSDTMLTFLNENWKQVSVEFGRPMMDAAAKNIVKNIAAFFNSNPIEDIAQV